MIKWRRSWFVALSFLLFVLGGAAHAEAELENICASVDQPVHWEYCITKTVGSTNKDLVYHLHGLGGDAEAWVNNRHGVAIRQTWEQDQKMAPIVITVSFGPVWLMASKNASPRSGIYDLYTQQIMPYLEQQVLGGNVGKRRVFGLSMGGFNAAMLYLKSADKFEAGVLACPGIVAVSPYASAREVADYIDRTDARPDYVARMIAMGRAFYPDDATWNSEAPAALAATRLGPTSPPLHISCGRDDEYGLFQSAKGFADLATARGVKVSWESLDGGHCVMNTESIARFLVAPVSTLQQR